MERTFALENQLGDTMSPFLIQNEGEQIVPIRSEFQLFQVLRTYNLQFRRKTQSIFFRFSGPLLIGWLLSNFKLNISWPNHHYSYLCFQGSFQI